MESYLPRIETTQAQLICQNFPSGRLQEERTPLKPSPDREVDLTRFDASSGRRQERVRTTKTHSITFGDQEIDLSTVNQLIENGQTRLIGDWLVEMSRGMEKPTMTLREICHYFEQECHRGTISDSLTGKVEGDRVSVRRFELAAAINRLRNLSIITP